MSRTVFSRRLPALIFALLAMFGLQPHAMPMAGAAAFAGTLCHSGLADPRPGDLPANRPLGDCDLCLLCSASSGYPALVLLVPAGVALPPRSVAGLIQAVPLVSIALKVEGTRGSWARAPPAAG